MKNNADHLRAVENAGQADGVAKPTGDHHSEALPLINTGLKVGDKAVVHIQQASHEGQTDNAAVSVA